MFNLGSIYFYADIYMKYKNYFKESLKNMKNLSANLKNNQYLFLVIIFLLVLTDVFLIKENFDLLLFSTLGIYIVGISLLKTKSHFTFIYCLVLLALMFFLFLITSTSTATEKTGVWIFFFILIGIVQQLRE